MKQLNKGSSIHPMMGSKVSKGDSKKKAAHSKRGQRSEDGSLISRSARQATKRIEQLDAIIATTRRNMERKIGAYKTDQERNRNILLDLQKECKHPRLAREKGEWVCAVCLKPASANLK